MTEDDPTERRASDVHEKHTIWTKTTEPLYGNGPPKPKDGEKKKPKDTDPDAYGCGRWIDDDDIFAKDGPMPRD
jgi:hypothetical protein